MSGIIACPMICGGNKACPICAGSEVAQCFNDDRGCPNAAETFDPETGELFCAACWQEELTLRMDDAA